MKSEKRNIKIPLIVLAAALVAAGVLLVVLRPWEWFKDSRSVLIYMCGSNLETNFGAATNNIEEMLSAELPEGVHVILETGGAKKWRNYDISNENISRYAIENGALTLLESLPQADMSTKETFSDFVNYGMEHYPAKHTAVILWDHGSGCVSGMISDENYPGGSLSIEDICQVLADAEEQHRDASVDLLGMDACLMANLETANALKDCADYMVASEDIEPTGGWDYTAFFGALAENKDMSATELGKAICDGFYKKYVDSDKSSATLSLIDLSKVEELCSRFDETIGYVSGRKIETEDIRQVAQSAYHSDRCGASSGATGYSNLIDLRDFAKYYGDFTENTDLSEVVLDCVVYKVCVDGEESVGGLSFYYPLDYHSSGFQKYYEEICPMPAYKAYLKQVYENIPEETVEIEKAVVTEDGALQVDITEDSMAYMLDAEYDLREMRDYKEESADDITVVRWLGTDNDIQTENDGRTYISNFRGVTLALNGVPLWYYIAAESKDKYFFEAPLSVNGKECSMRFAFVWDESMPNNGYYEIVGLWSGIGEALYSGMVDKGFQPLNPEDDVEVPNMVFDEADQDGGGSDWIKVPKNGDDYRITEEPLEGKDYYYSLCLIDIYGRANAWVDAVFRMEMTPEELKAHPLDDGEYAAKVIKILDIEE